MLLPAALLDQLDKAVLQLDGAGRLVYLSRAWSHLSGFPVDACLGRGLADYLHADDRQPLMDALVALSRNTETPDSQQMRLRHRAGDYRAVTLTLSPLRDDNSQSSAIAGILAPTPRAAFEDQFRALTDILEITLSGYWDWNLVANTEYLSPAFKRMFGYADHELPNSPETWQRLIFPEDLPTALACFEQHVQSHGRVPFYNEVRYRHRDGSTVWVICAGRVIDWAGDGTPLRMVGCHVDITGRKRDEERLRLAANVFLHAREGITITDAEGRIIDVNRAFAEITGYSRAEVLGQNPRVLQSGRHDRAFYTAMWQDLLDKGHWYGEIWNRRRSGEIYPELLTISAVGDEQHQTRYYVAMFLDISAQKRHQRELEHIAHFDALTGLPNRLLLADRLDNAMAQARRRGERLAVVYLDLDGFKAVNDHHGHRVGDQLLMTLAQRMQRALRDGDTIARIGGDEFVAVLVDLPDTGVTESVLARLLASAAQPVHDNGLILQVSASLGVSFYPQAEEISAEQLIRQADQAMYQAKVAGKNRFRHFDAELDRSLRGRNENLEDIQRALGQGEFVLYYQPLVNLRSGQIVGAEALVRWWHPRRGLLLPGAFLPAIENHPLIVDLGEWVLQQALGQGQRWRAGGLEIPISVNIHGHQFQRGDFPERLQSLLHRHGGENPVGLQLEMLETSALEDLDHMSVMMRSCQKLGVRFALDDFGTGYSSLTYLKLLPADCLKIDRSFVQDMLDDPDDLAILEGVLGLATAFRRQVVAEGVETPAQGEMLLRLGCEVAQGYAIAPPMPADELHAWAGRWRPEPSWAGLSPVSRDDLPLLFAGVEHRAWIRALADYLQNKKPMPPPLDEHQCRFGVWLREEGRRRHGTHPTLHALETVHRQIHDLALALIRPGQPHGTPETLAGLDELHRLRDVLLGQLTQLLDRTRE